MKTKKEDPRVPCRLCKNPISKYTAKKFDGNCRICNARIAKNREEKQND